MTGIGSEPHPCKYRHLSKCARQYVVSNGHGPQCNPDGQLSSVLPPIFSLHNTKHKKVRALYENSLQCALSSLQSFSYRSLRALRLQRRQMRLPTPSHRPHLHLLQRNRSNAKPLRGYAWQDFLIKRFLSDVLSPNEPLLFACKNYITESECQCVEANSDVTVAYTEDNIVSLSSLQCDLANLKPHLKVKYETNVLPAASLANVPERPTSAFFPFLCINQRKIHLVSFQ